MRTERLAGVVPVGPPPEPPSLSGPAAAGASAITFVLPPESRTEPKPGLSGPVASTPVALQVFGPLDPIPPRGTPVRIDRPASCIPPARMPSARIPSARDLADPALHSIPHGIPAPLPAMPPLKRAGDILLVLLLTPLALPLAALLAVAIRIADGAPVLHVAERMQAPGRSFRLYKFRSLRPGSRGIGALGGDRASAITPLGRILRRSRLDELPQLWNILRGDMSFVGPRPPEPIYVARRPDLYARVLQSRPGMTGLATLVFHAHEERLLAACRSAAETDATYMRRCLPRKARLDLIWQRRSSPARDAGLLALTFARVLRLPVPKRALHGLRRSGR